MTNIPSFIQMWMAWLLAVIPELRVLTNPKWRIMFNDKYSQVEQSSKFLALIVYSHVPPTSQLLQYCWLLSHACTIVGCLAYGYWYTDTSLLWYSFTTSSVVTTYFLVTYRHISLTLGKRLQAISQSSKAYAAGMISDLNKNDKTVVSKVEPVPLSVVLKSENTHLLGNALLIATTNTNGLKLVPMAMYSFMNLVTFYLNNACPVDDSIVPLVNYGEDGLLIVAAAFDNALPLVYLSECFGNGFTNGIHALVLYCIIYGLRLDNSESTRMAFKTLLKLWKLAISCLPFCEPVVTVLMKAELLIFSKTNHGRLNKNINIPKKRVTSTTVYDDTLSIIYDY
ncbi:uncharacterized protein KQ657_005123 [Scheffersomyces spartinae]|uniref:Uncharacterized protein n=1 Tax=Scheffersomyces spartinae TaxID=45513 RepID=A0A9P7V9Q9_9ASCO|nr:uncharacterized protein KQ657_005123 [Scheffersomyces spartinae]KAG7193924.1 hypothetical protein KQ657_005123 [Scheffersomyces spartinae]